jgi:tetratricopeptide (TPR) repeat protein
MAVNLKDCAPFASIHSPGLGANQLSMWDEIFEEGITNEAAGSYERALALYRKAADIDPRFAELRFRMGRCDLALTNDDQAWREFELARDDDALDFRSDTRINSIIQEAAARHAGQGVYLLDAANILAQSSPSGIPGLELFYEHVHLNFWGNYLLALNFAEEARKLLPDSIAARDKGDWASAELCDGRLAVSVWERQRVWRHILNTIESPPFTGQFNHDAMLKIYEAKMSEANSLMNTQTPRQAMQMYEQALALAPNDYFLHLNFVAFLEAKGFLSQAIVEARHCCELLPWVPGIHYHTATLLVREGETTEAADYFSRALAIQNDYAEALEGMGEILANEQKTDQAMDWFKRAIRANPDYVETYLDLGFLEQNQEQMDAAMASYQKAASLEPDGPADYFNQANIAAVSYQWDQAIACLHAVVKARPDFWQAHYQLGIQLAAKGQTQEAQREFSEAIRYRPDFVPAHLDLGTALAAQGKTNQALAQFRTALQFDPANSSAHQQIETIETASPHNP